MAEAATVERQSQAKKRSYPKRNINNSNRHLFSKRTPKKHILQQNAVYVTRKTSIKAHLVKCEKLLNEKFDEIVIHSMGAAIQQGINLALQLCEKNPEFQLSTNTSTVTLIDDFEPLTDEDDYESQSRPNSAIHIRVFKSLKPTAISSTS